MERLTIKEILNRTVDYFKEHNVDNPRLDAEVLLSWVLNMERINLYVSFDKPLSKEEVDSYRKAVIKRIQKIPVAYIIGSQEFMSLDFNVNQNVLIPRPETEHLVEKLLEEIEVNNLNDIKIADIGTGSGAIIISIIKLAKSNIDGIAVDISEDALEVAKENAINHDVDGRIEFKKGNLLEPIVDKVDIIVSNPPYIPTTDLDELHSEVRKEPELALDGGLDGLDYYRRIIKDSKEKLKDEGLILLEIGIEQAEGVTELLERIGFSEVEVIKDYAGIDRVVSAKNS